MKKQSLNFCLALLVLALILPGCEDGRRASGNLEKVLTVHALSEDRFPVCAILTLEEGIIYAWGSEAQYLREGQRYRFTGCYVWKHGAKAKVFEVDNFKPIIDTAEIDL